MTINQDRAARLLLGLLGGYGFTAALIALIGATLLLSRTPRHGLAARVGGHRRIRPADRHLLDGNPNGSSMRRSANG